ncbi:hypothetical protein DW921_01310 [Phocaeicola coprophilus]|uniref:Uncharacterized protein n=1 Tax=Phocaeicola coprophilus TaxID=387090 RepID=A0A413T4L2_9BACT|nr:hypothetical protein DW921_01310 [Phocaeicola coprophilus]
MLRKKYFPAEEGTSMLYRKGISPSGVKLLPVRKKTSVLCGSFYLTKQLFRQEKTTVSSSGKNSFMPVKLEFHATGTFVSCWWNFYFLLLEQKF